MDFLKNFARKKSIHISYINTGSCNGCDLEILACLGPRYDIEQYGMFMHQPNPRETDIALITGPVTDKWEDKLGKLYEKIPEPKAVISIGQCGCSGSLFEEGNTNPPVEEHIPVDAKVPGCPPRPQEIVDKLLEVSQEIFEDYGDKND